MGHGRDHVAKETGCVDGHSVPFIPSHVVV